MDMVSADKNKTVNVKHEINLLKINPKPVLRDMIG